MSLNTIPEIIEDIRAGKMVILMDDEDRENEGDLVMAATHVRPEDINFIRLVSQCSQIDSLFTNFNLLLSNPTTPPTAQQWAASNTIKQTPTPICPRMSHSIFLTIP